MEPVPHLTYSLGAAALGYAVTGSLSLAAGLVMGGVMIDIDHLPECWRLGWYKNFKEFKFMLDHRLHNYIILVLHSWEIYLLLAWVTIDPANLTSAGLLAGGASPWAWAGLGAALGGLLHLFLDQVTNPVRWYAYFFCYRLVTGFQGRLFLRKDEYQRRQLLCRRRGFTG